MELRERLKVVRKHFKMTQADFGKALGCSRDTIANYEGGRAVPAGTFLQLICAKFSINEDWLTNEQGSMMLDNENTLFASFSKQYGLSESEQRAARYLLQLSSEERQQILRHITGLAEAIASPDHAPSDIDAELEAYKQELLAAEKGLSASATGAEKEDA